MIRVQIAEAADAYISGDREHMLKLIPHVHEPNVSAQFREMFPSAERIFIGYDAGAGWLEGEYVTPGDTAD